MATTDVSPIAIEPDPAADRDHRRDFSELAERLERGGRHAEAAVAAVQRFEVALPSWALATGGTRFGRFPGPGEPRAARRERPRWRSEEHTSELQSHSDLVCRLLLEKKKKKK